METVGDHVQRLIGAYQELRPDSKSGTVLEADPGVDYHAWKQGARRPERLVAAANEVAVKTDAHFAEPAAASSSHGILLAEPALVPDLRHTGVRHTLGQEPQGAATPGAPGSTRYFYPNGTKGLSMRLSIQATLRGINDELKDPIPKPEVPAERRARAEAVAAITRDMDAELRRRKLVKYGLTTGVHHHKKQDHPNGLPGRTSLVNRPGTGASANSTMRERGSKIRIYAKTGRQGESPGGDFYATVDDDSASKGTASSVETIALHRNMTATHHTMEIAMRQTAPRSIL